jgi:hypothetical protein
MRIVHELQGEPGARSAAEKARPAHIAVFL